MLRQSEVFPYRLQPKRRLLSSDLCQDGTMKMVFVLTQHHQLPGMDEFDLNGNPQNP